MLFGLARSIGQKVYGGIELDVTNEELADSANITPYTTSRLISEWHSSGAIRRHRGKILLLAPETFLGWSEGKVGVRSSRAKNKIGF